MTIVYLLPVNLGPTSHQIYGNPTIFGIESGCEHTSTQTLPVALSRRERETATMSCSNMPEEATPTQPEEQTLMPRQSPTPPPLFPLDDD